MTLKSRFISMLLFVMALALAASVISMCFSWQMMRHYQDVINDDVIAEQLMLQLQAEFRSQVHYASLALEQQEQEAKDEHWALFDDAMKRLDMTLEDYKSLLVAERADIADSVSIGIENRITDFESAHQRLLEAWEQDEAPSPALIRQTSDALSQAAAAVIKVASGRTNHVQQSTQYKLLLNSLFVLISMVIALGIGYYFIKKTVLDRAQALVEYLEYIADGDFTHPVANTGTGKDEIGQVFIALQSVQDKIGVLMKGINQSATDLEHASQQLAEISHDSKDKLHAETAAIGSMSQAIHSVSRSAVDITEHSNEAADASHQSAEQSHKALATFNQADAVTRDLLTFLQQASEKANKLVTDYHSLKKALTSIRELSQHTNALALSAALEIGKMENRGQGATLVDEIKSLASEVNALTDTMQESLLVISQDTEGLVSAMAKSVMFAEKNNHLSQDTAAVIGQLDSAMTQVQTMSDNIHHEVLYQQRLLEDIDSSVTHVEEMAQRTEKISDHIADSTDNLFDLACRLHKKTEQFKV